MPKGQQRKIKGAICNIPVECDQTCNQLPRLPHRSGIIMLKLKKKLQFRGHVYFQADKLINGQIGTVVKIYVNPNTQMPSKIFIKFDDDKAGQNMINIRNKIC